MSIRSTSRTCRESKLRLDFSPFVRFKQHVPNQTRRQLPLVFSRRGGKRRGAGRKPSGVRAGTPHRKREAFDSERPVIVTKKVLPGVWSLRGRSTYAAVRRAIAGANRRGIVRVVHYAVMGNHLHLLVEAGSSGELARGLQGLWIRMARELNRVMGRVGRVFADRFHSRVLHSPREARNGIAYVLCNARRHGLVRRAIARWVDPFSSAREFDGWKKKIEARGGLGAPVEEPQTWLLRVGWRRYGLLDPAYVPG